MGDVWSDIRDHAQDLGAQLRRRRETAGVTLFDLALQLGVDAPLLSRIENGKAIPTKAQAAHLVLMFPENPLQQPLPLPQDEGGTSPIHGPGWVGDASTGVRCDVCQRYGERLPDGTIILRHTNTRCDDYTVRRGTWARTGDPESSHRTVASIDRDTDLHALVREFADMLARYPWSEPQSWNDWNLTRWIEHRTGRMHQRNVIARARGRVERDGYIERSPHLYPDHRGRKVLHFRKAP